MASAEAYMASLNAILYPHARVISSKVQAGDSNAPAATPSSSGTCYLLELPKELRLQIIDYYLISVPTLVKLEQYHYIYEDHRYWQPPLSLTCRRLRSETLPVFYRRCRFHLQGFNEDGDCEVSSFLDRTSSYDALPENLRTVVIHGFIVHSGRWLGEFDLGTFDIKVDRHWKHSMEGEYTGMMEDIDRVLQRAKKEVGARDSRAPVLRDLLAIMRGRGVFLW
jgi:hypothetical protein